jgi:hypothetical protein
LPLGAQGTCPSLDRPSPLGSGSRRRGSPRTRASRASIVLEAAPKPPAMRAGGSGKAAKPFRLK